MEHPAPIESLPEAAHKPLRGPAPLKMMVARGLAPLPPPVLVSALYALAYDTDPALASAATATLAKLPPPVIDGALGSAALPAAVLDDLATRLADRPAVVERIVQHANAADETVARIASRANEALCELIATNEQRLLRAPAIIEAMYLNRALRMSTADRLIELAARNGVELSIPCYRDIVASLQNQLIPEAGEAMPSDEAFRAALAEAAALDGDGAHDEDVVDRDDDGQETVKSKFREVEKKLSEMSTTEKIRAAIIGTPSHRMLLVRSPNPRVARAAISSPKMQLAEAEKVSQSPQVGEDVLRFIAKKPEWFQSYRVKVNLCNNPKTPAGTSLGILAYLRDADLRAVARSRNIPQALRQGISQLTSKRTKS
jgi:hypothetical protein